MSPFARFFAFLCLCALGASHAAQQGSTSTTIFSCVDSQGRRHTSDRPIPECHRREQRLLNADGSLRSLMPPAMSPAERAEKEQLAQQAAQARAAQQNIARMERNLFMRYPTPEDHEKARAKALDDVRQSITISQRRLVTLAQERQVLNQEVAALAGKNQPLRLRQLINANEATTQAHQDLVQSQTEEIERLSSRFDAELAVLKKLWVQNSPETSGQASNPPPSSP